jgi:hypothetical protein
VGGHGFPGAGAAFVVADQAAIAGQPGPGLIAEGNLDLIAELGIVPDRPLPYRGWGMIPDPYGRLFETDHSQAPIPDPPSQPWPWANAPEPANATWHCPGQYTRTVDLLPRTPDDDLDDDLDGDGA